ITFNRNVTDGVGKEVAAPIQSPTHVAAASHSGTQGDADKIRFPLRGAKVLLGDCEGVRVVLHGDRKAKRQVQMRAGVSARPARKVVRGEYNLARMGINPARRGKANAFRRNRPD